MSELPDRRQGMVLRSGVHRELEDVANEMLRVSMAGVTRHAEKSDLLTPWKEKSRKDREVYVPSGTPDPALRRGIITRAWNGGMGMEHLNSVEGYAPVRKKDTTRDSGRETHTSIWDGE